MLSILATIFSNNILPIFLTAGAGLLIGKLFSLDTKTLSRLTFYLFSPSLVFSLISNSEVDAQSSLQMVSFAVIVTFSILIVSLLISKVFKFDRSFTAAFILVSVFPNAGNYGLTINELVYGETALTMASLYFVTSAILIYSLGVFIASLGRQDFKQTLKNLAKLPVIYALLFGLIVNGFGLVIPTPITSAVNILAKAAIPSMLVLLGLQLGNLTFKAMPKTVVLASAVRLIIAPIFAILLSNLFALNYPSNVSGILEASMPTAVMITVLATEYELYPDFATSVVSLSTLLSPIFLTPLIYFLGAS